MSRPQPLPLDRTTTAAVNLGYNVILATEACSAATPEAHEATLGTFALLGTVAPASDIQPALDQVAEPPRLVT